MKKKFEGEDSGARRVFLSEGEAPFDVWTEIRAVGEDVDIIVGGGSRPHIGSVALAEPAVTVNPVTGETIRAQGDGTGFCRISVMSAAAHKDAAIAEMFAGAFCDAFCVNVCAGAGVHVGDATEKDIEKLMGNAAALLKRALSAWGGVAAQGV
ncbi:MAG: hypothetical protein LBR00_03400, partial [Clostridiales Family XIII bacterium]|jgi:hypothetical protein|nr:hypothetical protein [Clostridiales Family XIII bacterium]